MKGRMEERSEGRKVGGMMEESKDGRKARRKER